VNFFKFDESIDVICNVGGFGIDGPVSTLLGQSVSNRDRLYFGQIGDLAFFYDMNALGNRHVGGNLRILLVNNNLGVEFRISERISLDVIGHYSPYDYFNRQRKIRILAIQPEVRYWWGEPLVRGHFIGLHAPVAGFNIQLNDHYRYQDPNHALWGVGISYGYAMPLGKSGRWGVEFTIGVGYLDINYNTYEGVCNGKYLSTKRENYFGPTRLGINFSYRIDRTTRGNHNKTIGER
jgi:hypothetical protein